MKGLKFVVIGGGSSYTPELVEGIIKKRDTLPVSELILVDIEEGREKVEINYNLVKRMFKKEKMQTKISFTLDRKEALKGADFVLSQFRVGRLEARARDERIPLERGFVGQETTGAGGFAKALRTIPVILDICKDIEEVAKDAWLINFTNPAGIITEAVNKYSNVKVIGLCNVPINMKYDAAEELGVSAEKIRTEIMGLNHLSFVTKVMLNGENKINEILKGSKLDGKDTMKNIEKIDDFEEYNKKIGLISSPYLQYFFFPDKMIEKELKNIKDGKGTRAVQVMKIEKTLFEKYKDVKLDIKPKELEERGGARYSEIAINLIDSIYNNLNNEYVVNVVNNGSIVDLPENVVVEVNCIVNNEGARPLHMGHLPKSVKGLIQQVKSYEEYTIEAAVEGNREKALIALINNPLVRNVDKAEELLEEILNQNKKYLSNFFKED
ncbi:6-phospho-beta-glucosidase [Haliovirga abyssi]|uniref:6-phospho-beta-glucosidase n=1 Tax=Haliovirga abyssi TaxID=2996794 RepID=A0AAU9DSH3_9FUSO|nr:6-phospho-beta-glucosidase [Haliovirga abyssi]BDU51583.1 6-phospho-beta-glucosidase [Haliovirga abyssi]